MYLSVKRMNNNIIVDLTNSEIDIWESSYFFFLSNDEYKDHENIANNADKSPLLKSKLSKILKSNFVIMNRTLVKDNATPNN